MNSILQLAALLALAIATPFFVIAWTSARPGAVDPGLIGYLVLGGIPLLWLGLTAALLYWIGDWHLVGVVAGGLATLGLVRSAKARVERPAAEQAPILLRVPPPAWIDPES